MYQIFADIRGAHDGCCLVGGGHRLPGSQRERERELARHMPAIQRLLPASQRRSGGFLRRGLDLHIPGGFVHRLSQKELNWKLSRVSHVIGLWDSERG